MWARVVECMLGCWLAISPFVFRYPSEARFLWFNDFASALLVMLISLFSFHHRLRRLHLVNAALAVWLVAVALVRPPTPPPAPYQNYVIVGLLLLMFAVVPNRSAEPPRRWRAFYENRQRD